MLAYEELRASVISGGVPEGANVRRLARFGLGGLLAARPAWQVAMSESPEPRWSGGNAHLASLMNAYELVKGAKP